MPLIPPPPAPLNTEPSRARRRLADRLARRNQEAEQEVAASEFGSEADDPFAALGDNEDQEAGDPFSLDEEEQDITTFGKRSNVTGFASSTGDHHSFSVSRGLTSLFSSNSGRDPQPPDDFDGVLDDSSTDSSGSDIDPDHPPVEARTSLERRPLDIDDDEEMGEMVAPTEEGNSSDEEGLSSLEEKSFGFGAPAPEEPSCEFDGQADQDDDDDDDGDALVEIAMPTARRTSRSSIVGGT